MNRWYHDAIQTDRARELARKRQQAYRDRKRVTQNQDARRSQIDRRLGRVVRAALSVVVIAGGVAGVAIFIPSLMAPQTATAGAGSAGHGTSTTIPLDRMYAAIMRMDGQTGELPRLAQSLDATAERATQLAKSQDAMAARLAGIEQRMAASLPTSKSDLRIVEVAEVIAEPVPGDASTTPEPQPEPQQVVLYIRRGSCLRPSLEAWANSLGWSLVWDVPDMDDLCELEPTVLEGDNTDGDGVLHVLRALKRSLRATQAIEFQVWPEDAVPKILVTGSGEDAGGTLLRRTP